MKHLLEAIQRTLAALPPDATPQQKAAALMAAGLGDIAIAIWRGRK